MRLCVHALWKCTCDRKRAMVCFISNTASFVNALSTACLLHRSWLTSALTQTARSEPHRTRLLQVGQPMGMCSCVRVSNPIFTFCTHCYQLCGTWLHCWNDWVSCEFQSSGTLPFQYSTIVINCSVWCAIGTINLRLPTCAFCSLTVRTSTYLLERRHSVPYFCYFTIFRFMFQSGQVNYYLLCGDNCTGPHHEVRRGRALMGGHLLNFYKVRPVS